MQRPQFGQRGITVNGEPVSIAASGVRPVSQPTAQTDYQSVGALRVVGILFVAFMFLAWLEALLSGTSLITPINQTLLWGMRGVGLVVGIVVTVLTVMTMTDTSLLRRGMRVLFCPLLIAFGFGEIAYRISDWAEFGFSSQPFDQAQYPIASLHHGRRGTRSSIEIDPFAVGETTDIPIPSEQYYELTKAPASSCVTVMQRKSASGAVEIQTDGVYVLKEPEAVPVGPCGFSPSEAKPAPSGSANPWSKD